MVEMLDVVFIHACLFTGRVPFTHQESNFKKSDKNKEKIEISGRPTHSSISEEIERSSKT